MCLNRTSPNPSEFEAVFCKLISATKSGRSIDLGCIYRPPGANRNSTQSLIDFLDSSLSLTTDSNAASVICGDFNYRNINWDKLTSTRDQNQHEFLDFTINKGLSQVVNFPTRNENLLDLIFISEPDLVQCPSEGMPIYNCDHKTVLANIMIQKPKNILIRKRDYARCDFESLNNELQNENWDVLLAENGTLNANWNNFLTNLRTKINRYAPLRTTHVSTKCQNSPLTIKLCKESYRLHKIYKKSNDNQDYLNYLEMSAKAQRAKRRDKFNHEDSILKSGNISQFWKFIKSRLQYKDSLPCIFGDNDSVILSDNQSKANRFNKYFASVFTQDDGNLPHWPINYSVDQISEINFSYEDVYNKLIKLTNKNSSGPDCLPTSLMKKLAPSLAEPLSRIFQQSFNSSSLPDEWKLAEITPIFKNKGSNNKCENYRPISLTSQSCRIMESLVADKIREFIRPKLDPNQHGFLPGKSTVTQLLETISDWTNSMNEGRLIDVLYVDFAKAFDSCSHPKLISKMEKYGIRGKLLNWVKAYLKDRKQVVKIENSKSQPEPVTSGVPQGSSLSPLLWLIYISDLTNEIKHCKIKLFADDCKIYIVLLRNNSVHSSQLMQEDINNLMNWAKNSQLNIAFQKCAVLHIGKKNPKTEYYFGDIKIPKVSSMRDLGVIVDEKLSFKEHYAQVSKSANIKANLILKCFYSRSIPFLIKMFNTFVRSKLEYASQVWNPYKLTDINLLERPLRRFTKRLPGQLDLNYGERLHNLRIDCLELRRLKLDLVMTFKIMHGFLDVNKSQFFQLRENNNTRGHSLMIYKKRSKNNIHQNFFSQRVIQVWNSLSEEIVTAATVNAFKAALQFANLNRFLRGEGPRRLM